MTSKELQNRQVTITSLDEDDKTINFLFGYIAGISSTKVKEEFLSQHMSPLVEQILKDTYGGRKYHIKNMKSTDQVRSPLILTTVTSTRSSMTSPTVSIPDRRPSTIWSIASNSSVPATKYGSQEYLTVTLR